MKYAGFHEEFAKNHLVGEMVANKLALDLQLPAAEPCLVRVEEAFLETLPDDQDGDALRMALQPTPLVAFGSRQIAPARRWEPSDLVHKSQAREAVMLYLFDTLVENSDRGNGNPNLLMSGLSFKIIDFGHSFQRCHDADAYCNGAKPWQVGGIGNHYQGNLQHIMFPRCRGLEEAVLHEFKASLLELSDDRIAAYVDVVPDDWGQDTTCRIIDYLIEAREHAEDFVNQVRGVLT